MTWFLTEKSVYEVEVLLDRVEQTVESLSLMDPLALIVLRGDFNRLGESEVMEFTCLILLILLPTRGKNIVDCLFVSKPCFATVKIVVSSIKTDHKVIIAIPGLIEALGFSPDGLAGCGGIVGELPKIDYSLPLSGVDLMCSTAFFNLLSNENTGFDQDFMSLASQRI